tara:strand:- start:17517 stop:18440 length:924 start_codon:yes stop_codon:yes gene_type:complete
MTLALQVDCLKKTYEGNTEALKGITFDVAEGDFFALLGPNGAGKSTIISIISSLTKKTSGKIFVFGKDIDQDFSVAKSYLGVVPQEFNFNIFETVENIIYDQAGYYGLRRSDVKNRLKDILQKLDLWDKRKYRANRLSGGMKRRLMIARALINNPKLLILDEPTSGVDVELRHSLWEFIKEINEQGTTIILTTHYLEEAENLCRNLAIINHGRIVAETSVKELLYQMDKEHLILYLDKEITFPLEIPNYKIIKIDASTIEVEVLRKYSLNPLFQALSDKNINVISMKNRTGKLEEFFIDLVSKKKPI